MHRVLRTFVPSCLTLSLFGLAFLAFGQSGGRFEEAKRLALAYLDSNQYDRAAGKLEEVWEQDQTDPTVVENLGLAYLNGDDRRYNHSVDEKARKVLEEAIHLGGKATFLVQHSHVGLVGHVTGGNSLDYCSGRLSISPGRLVFVMQAMKGTEDHSFDLKAADLKASGPDGSGFKIKTKPKNYSMSTRTKNKADSDLILSLIREHLGAGTQ